MPYELTSIKVQEATLGNGEDVTATVVPQDSSHQDSPKIVGAIKEGLPPPPPKKVRNQAIDFVRGLAIVVMLQANITPYVHHLEHPHIILRLIYSMAAPTFIFLSGYSACAFHKKAPDISSVLGWFSIFFNFNVQRVWFAAVYVDVIAWILYPLHSFDVLYVIGCGILTHGVFLRYDIKIQHAAYAIWFAAWVAIRYSVPYNFDLEDVSFEDLPAVPSAKHFFYRSLQQLFVSGWFPWFPWLLVAWSGGYFARLKLLRPADAPLWFRALTVSVFIITLVLYLYNGGTVNGVSVNGEKGDGDGEGYEEIFYPVTLHFFFFCQSCTVSLIWATSWLEQKLEGSWLEVHPMVPFVVLGRNSLFVYIWHSMFISYFFLIASATKKAGGAYVLLLTVVLFSCYAKEYFIKDVKKMPTIVRLITGI